jgi:alanyl-tRNA synthetase
VRPVLRAPRRPHARPARPRHPAPDRRPQLVNKGDARCIEIWNLVFIQFNANPDGTFVDLPAKHVDTGMGFERVTSMIQGTKGFTDFSENAKISNYETDVFRPIFDELEKLTGKNTASARERGLIVDKEGFNKLMDEQKKRSQAAQKKEVISLSQIETTAPTKFVGFEKLESPARVLEAVSVKDKTAVVLDTSPFYAEMGGQVGDTGELTGSGQLWRVTNTQKSGNTFLHFVEGGDAPAVGAGVMLAVEKARRNAIQRHHTVTHLLHWALHEVASKEASQKGSFVGPDKLTFDFNSAPLTPQQVADIEKLVNEKHPVENAG